MGLGFPGRSNNETVPNEIQVYLNKYVLRLLKYLVRERESLYQVRDAADFFSWAHRSWRRP